MENDDRKRAVSDKGTLRGSADMLRRLADICDRCASEGAPWAGACREAGILPAKARSVVLDVHKCMGSGARLELDGTRDPCGDFYAAKSYGIWKDACEHLEKAYIRLTKDLKLPAQQARDVLPNSTKSDIIMTATESEWQHVINLRYHGATGAPHPEMEEVMCIAYPILVEASDGRLG